MKNYAAILISFCSLALTAQNNFVLPNSSNQLILNSYGGVGSSGITQKFMNKFLFPDYIDKDLKDETLEILNERNLFGGSAYGQLNLFFTPKNYSAKSSEIFGIGFSSNLEGDLSFTKDLFKLTFYGNQPFAGEYLSLDKTSFNTVSYSNIEFSIGKTMSGEKARKSLWMDLGLVLGHSFTNFELEKASIYTEENGDYLDINIENSKFHFSDTLSLSIVQGFGAKLDLHYSYQTENTTLLFSAENLGGILWNNTTAASLDTSLKFEGIEIGSIFQLSDSVLNKVSTLDSLIKIESGSSFKALPINLTAYFQKELNVFRIDFLLRYRVYSNFAPYARFGANLSFPVVQPGISVAYGGYSNIQAGINADIKLLKKIKIQVGTNNVLGVLIPNLSTALDAYAGMRFKF